MPKERCHAMLKSGRRCKRPIQRPTGRNLAAEDFYCKPHTYWYRKYMLSPGLHKNIKPGARKWIKAGLQIMVFTLD